MRQGWKRKPDWNVGSKEEDRIEDRGKEKVRQWTE